MFEETAMLRILIIAGCAAVAALAVGTPRPASASPPPVYGERGAGLVESNLYRKRHTYPYGYVYRPYAYYVYRPYAYYVYRPYVYPYAY
jgi:hypothetical protein